MKFLSWVVLNFGLLKEDVITNVIWIKKLRKKNEIENVSRFQKMISYNTLF